MHKLHNFKNLFYFIGGCKLFGKSSCITARCSQFKSISIILFVYISCHKSCHHAIAAAYRIDKLAVKLLGKTYCSPASHGEGRFVAPKEWLDKLFENGQVATQYADIDGNVSMDEEWNINGSYMAIEGITSPDGRIFGKMAHAERRGDAVAINIYGDQDLKIFESGVKYFS